MKNDAEVHSAEDAQKKELIDIRNIADQMIYTAEKALKDHGDKVSEALKTGVNDKIGELRLKHTSEDITAIKTATEALSTEMQKIGEEMAKKGSDKTPAEGGETAPKEDPNIRDADVNDESKTT